MKITNILFLVVLIVLSVSCKNANKKDLAKIEQQELAKGIRNDSLFYGLYLGMPKLDFYNHCWAMNKKKIFNEGASMSVEYQFGKQNFSFPLQMNFYPQFKENKISEMPIKFTYKGIDLSFPNGQTEKLVKDVKKLMEEWYGEGFFITTLQQTGGKAYAKVSGNRRVLIFSEKEFEVMVVITDLMANDTH